jgi:hypothetical protein
MHNTTLLTTKKIHSSNYSDTLLLIFVVPIQNTKLVKVVYIVFRDNGKVSKTLPLKLPPYTKKKLIQDIVLVREPDGSNGFLRAYLKMPRRSKAHPPPQHRVLIDCSFFPCTNYTPIFFHQPAAKQINDDLQLASRPMEP